MAPSTVLALPADLLELYNQRRPAILSRLADFAAVPREAWFYELCYCLLTPQSKAIHANAVVENLKASSFFETGGDVVHLLRNKDTYIRFHNVKHNRLHALRERWTLVDAVIYNGGHNGGHNGGDNGGDNGADGDTAVALREALVAQVGGVGMKEASHFLRNIGFRGLAIIDRHLLTNLVRCGLYSEAPPVGAPSQYRAVEAEFRLFSALVHIDLDELDLLFWSAQTGIILK